MRPPRPAAVTLALCLSVAAGPLAGWLLSRPADSVGVRPGGPPAVPGPASTAADAAVSGGDAPALHDAPQVRASSAAPPTRLRIPAIGVDAPVVPMGVRGDGQMRLPRDVSRVGWYRFGPGPGAGAGSVVLAAHVDSRADGLGVFAKLRGAAPGDRVTVRTTEGPATYRVVSREQLAKRGLPLADLFRRDGPEVLTLVTCAGRYLPDAGGYQDNLVVTAVPVGR